ncbi:GNAT family N-acetyltransferase [Boseongicola aestuarii]|uniref:Putative N-acetyltransferase YsnE n=1 Tax=Boseongicola aestuarii TaxID=1470561 RepID=A0A238IVC3_9RHOB|nr:GNAT family N-acetyltransferase [Boseongicola aestuarii]SMX22327.1 putative N-acetyltransferase YsnE [Boseongicola aestuarii]
MTHRLEFVEAIPDGYRDILIAYLTAILPTFEAVSGIKIDAVKMADETLANPSYLLPPANRLLVAYDDTDTLVGCGSLRRIRPDAGEMKRMFVAASARGTGLGRAIFEERIAEARRMGLKWLYADTVKGNRPMINLYEKAGFDYIDRYPENANPPEFAPHLVFLRCAL